MSTDEPPFVAAIEDESDRAAVRAVLARKRWRDSFESVQVGPTTHTWMDRNGTWHREEMFNSPHYERCEDPECPVRYAYGAELGQPHWHFTGSVDHPAWDVG